MFYSSSTDLSYLFAIPIEQVNLAVIIWTYIQDVPGSSLRLDIGYTDRRFLPFFSVCPDISH